MTHNEAIIATMKSKIAKVTIKDLKKMAIEVEADLDVPTIVVDVVFTALMERTSEHDFVSFCDSL